MVTPVVGNAAEPDPAEEIDRPRPRMDAGGSKKRESLHRPLLDGGSRPLGPSDKDSRSMGRNG